MISSIALSTFITLGGWSTHFNKTFTNEKGEDVKYNDNHKALIVDVNGYTFGAFENSYFEPSLVAGYTWRTEYTYISLGVASGYKDAPQSCLESIKKACVLMTAGFKFEYVSVGLMGGAVITSLTFEF